VGQGTFRRYFLKQFLQKFQKNNPLRTNAERADKLVRMIVDTYFLPNKTLPELRAMAESGALDFLREFSEACGKEFAALTPAVFHHGQNM